MKQLVTFLFLIFTMLANGQNRLNMDSVFNWQDPTLVPSSAHFNTYNEIWGYAKDGNEYAIIGTTAGTHIFDVTVPESSTEVEFIEGAVVGPQIIHRDYHDHDDYLYMVCDEGASTLQIADLRFLPDSAPIVYDSDALFPRSHNIFIDTASARMYVCGGTVQFAVYSLADPENPTLLVDCPNDVPFWSSIGYVHDVFVRGDTAYLNAEWRGVFVVDFSDLNDITMIGSLSTYDQQGYNHSGWLMPTRPYYAFADETHGTDLKIVDVSDMSDLVITDTISSEINPNSIVHNLLYTENHLFVSHYFDGVYVYECSDPAKPTLAGYFDTSTETHQNGVYRGCWGVYPFLPSGNILVSDMQTGLWIFGSPLLSNNDIDFDERSFQVYPNPTLDLLWVPNELIGADFQVFDLNGRAVLSGQLENQLTTSELLTGMYTLRALGQKGAVSIRFIKK